MGYSFKYKLKILFLKIHIKKDINYKNQKNKRKKSDNTRTSKLSPHVICLIKIRKKANTLRPASIKCRP